MGSNLTSFGESHSTNGAMSLMFPTWGKIDEGGIEKVGAEVYIPILRPRIHYTWTRLSEAPASADIAMAKCDLWEEERRRTITSLRKCFWKSLSDSSELSIKKLDFELYILTLPTSTQNMEQALERFAKYPDIMGGRGSFWRRRHTTHYAVLHNRLLEKIIHRVFSCFEISRKE
jgi:hypothetical protein